MESLLPSAFSFLFTRLSVYSITPLPPCPTRLFPAVSQSSSPEESTNLVTPGFSVSRVSTLFRGFLSLGFQMPRERAAQGSPAPSVMNAKHSSLMQDYLQLQDEFAALEDRLQAAKMAKATLNAEVRFLRLRLKKLKGSRSNLIEKEINSVIMPCNSLTAYRSKAVFGAFMPELSSHSPKNNSLGTTEIPVFRELPRTNNSEEHIKQKCVNEHTGLVSAPETSAFRNSTNVFTITMAGKRKVSWQDEISLKCN